MDDRKPPKVTPESVRADLRRTPAARPNAAYRARVRAAFLDGRLEETARRRGAPNARRFLPFVAAAALLLLVLILRTSRPGESWMVSRVSGSGSIEVDGRAWNEGVARSAAAKWLRPGARITLGAETGLELVLKGSMVLELAPGSAVVLPRREGDAPESYVGVVDRGVLRICTAPGFRGRRLYVRTPEARVEVHGTTLSVLRDEQGTCVCVLEGSVLVRAANDSTMTSVKPGTRRYAPSGRAAAFTDEIRTEERAVLTDLERRARSL